jgi:hypothetical protein
MPTQKFDSAFLDRILQDFRTQDAPSPVVDYQPEKKRPRELESPRASHPFTMVFRDQDGRHWLAKGDEGCRFRDWWSPTTICTQVYPRVVSMIVWDPVPELIS